MTKRNLSRPSPPMVAPDPNMIPPESYVASPVPGEGILPPQGVQVTPTQVSIPQEDLEKQDPDVEKLTPEEHALFASLLTCGRKTNTVDIFNHIVVVQSLCGDDDLRIGMYVKDYQGSLGESRAYQIGVAAAGIRTIDGTPLVTSLFADADEATLFDEKVKRVSKMYPVVINRIYRAVLDAEKDFVELTVRLGKSDG